MTNVNTRLLLVCEEAFKTKTLLQLTENTKYPQLKRPPQHFSYPHTEPLGTTLTTAPQCQINSHRAQRGTVRTNTRAKSLKGLNLCQQ